MYTDRRGHTQPLSSPRDMLRALAFLPHLWWHLLCSLPTSLCSQIYCHGEILHQVQMAKLYQDDKQFVDMPLSSAPGEAPGGPPPPEPPTKDDRGPNPGGEEPLIRERLLGSHSSFPVACPQTKS